MSCHLQELESGGDVDGFERLVVGAVMDLGTIVDDGVYTEISWDLFSTKML